MKTTLRTLLLILMPIIGYTQGDDCATATFINLPAPNPCPAESGTVVSTNLTNIGATGPVPYVSIINCLGDPAPGDDMYSPAVDVWVSFTVTGTVLDLDITSTMSGVSWGLWSGPCTDLVPEACDFSATGNISSTIEPLFPGQTYYLQISGSDPTDVSDFVLDLESYDNCDICNTVSNLTVSPPPTNGGYAPGTTVDFCYTIDEWINQSNNWVHGIVPSFGSGWDLSTLTPVSAPGECSSTGDTYGWFWLNSTTSTATGATTGTGLYVDLDPSGHCLLYTSPSPRDVEESRMPSSA